MFISLAALDGSILIWIQEHLRVALLDAFMVFYTNLGDHGLLWLFLCLCLLCHPRTRKAGICGFCAIALGALFTNVIIKQLVSRTRPYLALEYALPLVISDDPNSFPSGHTCAAFAAAAGWWRSVPYRWMKITGLVLAVLMGCSRLYTGVHYPSDVLAGAAVGWLSGMIIWKLNEKYPLPEQNR